MIVYSRYLLQLILKIKLIKVQNLSLVAYQWWNGLWSHRQFGVYKISSSLRNGINLQTWSVIRGWTCCIIITALLLLLGCNARVLCHYLGTNRFIIPKCFVFLWLVATNQYEWGFHTWSDASAVYFFYYRIIYLYSLLKFLIKFSIFDIKKKKEKKKSISSIPLLLLYTSWAGFNFKHARVS